uniref:Seminal fluid protein n=1 Tax=Nilaparvata lugens TaxID=108931 RepID=A0A1I9WL28_NILLU|nr:seminal fluid protein [Nilaparvata lugens]
MFEICHFHWSVIRAPVLCQKCQDFGEMNLKFKWILINVVLILAKFEVDCLTVYDETIRMWDELGIAPENLYIRSVVEIEYGLVRGFLYNTSLDQEHQSFTNIPYAKPPIGRLRFRPPEPPERWEGIRDCTKPPWHARAKKRCMQYLNWSDFAGKRIVGSEDCLYLSIIRPADLELENRERHVNHFPDGKQDADVVVFLEASTFMYDIPYSNHRMVANLCCTYTLFVFVRFRLGPLGFMTTGDSLLPANLGMKDQIAALSFVQRNINRFGGNPIRVTFAGVSAGAASVHLHIMSSLSNGLFYKAISISGSAMNPWAWAKEETIIELTRDYASDVNCSSRDIPTPKNEMVACLMEKRAVEIVRQHDNAFVFRNIPISAFSPTVDNDFLRAEPHQMLKSGATRPMPWLVSYTTEEAIFPLLDWFDREPYNNAVDLQWDTFAPYLLDYKTTMPENLQAQAAWDIKGHYTNGQLNQSLTEEPSQWNTLIRIMTDRLFASGIVESARYQARATPEKVWLYEFGYRGEFSMSNLLAVRLRNHRFGCGHAEDFLIYINGFSTAKLNITEDIRMREMLTWLWITFIVYDAPELEGTEKSTKRLPHVLEGIDVEPEYAEEIRYTKIRYPFDYTIERSGFLANKRFWRTIPTNDFY